MDTRRDTELWPKGQKKPKVIRRSGKRNSSVDLPTAQTEGTAMDTESAEGLMAEVTPPETVPTGIDKQTDAVPEHEDRTSAPPAFPPLPGFTVDGASRNQNYVLRNMLVLADCCVAATEDKLLDVLFRNFEDAGMLKWWLFRIGKGDLVPRLKGKDLVDAARIVAHALHRQLKKEVGLRIPRW